MTRPHRALAATALVAVSAAVFGANTALAANTGSVTVSHTPMVLAGSQSTTIRVVVPQATDPIAATQIYVPSGYGVNVSQPADTSIGTVDATAYSRDAGLTLPLSGTVATANPANYTTLSTVCAGTPTSKAVWILTLSIATTTLKVPLYVNPTTGAETALGAYKLSICLPPPDLPVGDPARAAQGAQLLEATFTVNGIFTTPTGGGLLKWATLFTPYNPGQGTPNIAGTFEARAFVPLPIILNLQASYKKATKTYTLSGRMSRGGLPAAGLTVAIARGPSATALRRAASAKTGTSGTFRLTGKLKPRKTTFFQATASVPESDYTTQGCKTPATTFAPAGCVSATLSPWSTKSGVLRIKS
jgi:hypothetical protein